MAIAFFFTAHEPSDDDDDQDDGDNDDPGIGKVALDGFHDHATVHIVTAAVPVIAVRDERIAVGGMLTTSIECLLGV